MSFSDTGLDDSNPDDVSRKIMMVGDGQVGKTSFIKCISGEMFDPSVKPTTQLDTHTFTSFDQLDQFNVSRKVNVWDSSNDNMHVIAYWRWYRYIDGFVLLFSEDVEKSWANVQNWIDEVRRNTDSPIVVCWNKTDMDVDISTIKKKEKIIGQRIHLISVKDGNGLNNVMKDLFGKIDKYQKDEMDKKNAIKERYQADQAKNYTSLNKPEKKPKKGCSVM